MFISEIGDNSRVLFIIVRERRRLGQGFEIGKRAANAAELRVIRRGLGAALVGQKLHAVRRDTVLKDRVVVGVVLIEFLDDERAEEVSRAKLDSFGGVFQVVA